MIESVYIDGLRSLTGFEQEFGPGITVVYGPNGCGKTSLLEGIYLLSQGFSFRAKDLKELIRWKADELILRGAFSDGDRQRSRAIRVHRRGNDVRENGENLKSASAFFGNCPAVIMQPSDIELLRGAPEVRRHWLDEILCFRSPANASVLRRYKRVLQQRNQWLRQYKKEGNAVGGEELFKVLTIQLVEQGAKLWAARLNLSREISPIITSYYRKLSGGVDEITCAYKSSILKELDAMDGAEFLDDDGLDEAAAGSGEVAIAADVSGAYSAESAVDEEVLRVAFQRKLEGLEFVEKMQGMTMSGPHKDDLALCIGGYEMRSVGSQGQCRSAAVAMRFAAVDVATRYVEKPILLLDDIFAELDVNRRDAVAALIREKQCQVVIATPQKEDLPFMADAEIILK
ncbi:MULTISPECIES: DNA replication/repair protein RecF [unclassified Fibrobacter]|uniref:DNA replication/repair protein RecF n=1 Tax=unclassified Fibrobacter TaxID=2634177 RepID=UPI000D6BA4C4|nr:MULTISPECIES: DNA replication and repair protein RecF [unclassified Fibrobacter]PWJ65577.1 DNA replication and repair protein RecF [Fibrobacter sp. UWR4]PZW72342.1 DNA replication and repair protein RecF [Fibrobacter sp. UWR1]